MRHGAVRGEHAEQAAGLADEGRGLHGTHLRGQHDLEGQGPHEDRALPHVLHDHTFAALHGDPAGGLPGVCGAEKGQKGGVKAVLRDQL
jgi:hypothetical protein